MSDLINEETNEIIDRVLPIPCEAVGRIIGKNGQSINWFRQWQGINYIDIKKKCPNWSELYIGGLTTSVNEVLKEITFRIDEAQRKLHNTTRKEHSWTLSKSLQLLPSRVIHKTGDRAPHVHTTGIGKNFYAAKMQGKHKEKELYILKSLKKEQREQQNALYKPH